MFDLSLMSMLSNPSDNAPAPRRSGSGKHLGFAALSLMLSSLTPMQAEAVAEPKLLCPAEPANMDIVTGNVVECSISPVGDQDLFRFSGTANTTIILSLLDQNGTDCRFYGVCPIADLFAPDGTKLKHLRSTDSQAIVLPANGTYLVRISDEGDNQTANYRIGLERLWPASPDTKAMSFEQVISNESINPAPDQDFYTFNALKDSTVTLTLSDLNGTDCRFYGVCPTANLYGPDQTLVSTWRSQSTKDIKLPQTGTYTLHLFDEGNDREANYSLFLQCLFPAPGQTQCDSTQPPLPPTCNGLTPTIKGTAGNDTIIGTSGNDVIAGLGGNDRIAGLGGNDVICGDSDQGGAGDDTLFGGDGNDTLLGGDGINVLFGDAGNDILKGGSNRDGLFGGAGNDSLDGQANDDVLIGGSGNDFLNGNTGTRDICDQLTDDLTPATGCEFKDTP